MLAESLEFSHEFDSLNTRGSLRLMLWLSASMLWLSAKAVLFLFTFFSVYEVLKSWLQL